MGERDEEKKKTAPREEVRKEHAPETDRMKESEKPEPARRKGLEGDVVGR